MLSSEPRAGVRRAAILLGAWIALGACTAPRQHPFFDDKRRPVIFAHRGGGGIEPEATLPTLLAARARDVEAVVEFDVRRTRDGHLVVIHDATVNRTTNGDGRVDRLTLAELQALDAGHCATPGKGDGTAEVGTCVSVPPEPAAFPFRGQGRRVPTLAEVLAALPADAPLSIEVKAGGFEREFVTALKATGRPPGQLMIGSEDDDVGVRLKDLLPGAAHFLPTGAGTCLALSAKLALDYRGCPDYDVFASPVSGMGLDLATRGVIEAAHDRGVAVVYWTINEEVEMDRLFRLGADGIFTDYPDRARRVVDRLRAEGVLP